MTPIIDYSCNLLIHVFDFRLLLLNVEKIVILSITILTMKMLWVGRPVWPLGSVLIRTICWFLRRWILKRFGNNDVIFFVTRLDLFCLLDGKSSLRWICYWLCWLPCWYGVVLETRSQLAQNSKSPVILKLILVLWLIFLLCRLSPLTAAL